MLRQMPRKAQQLRRHVGPPLGQLALDIDAAFGKALEQIGLAVKPVMGLRDHVNDCRIYA